MTFAAFYRIAFVLMISASCLPIHRAEAEVIYATEFENFTPGADQLVGTDGWLSTLNGQSLHGIDEADKFVPGIGQTAFLGFTAPASPGTQTVSVFRPLNVDPSGEGKPIVEFEVLVDIADSRDVPGTPINEALRKDRFLFTVYNIAGQTLASIIYDLRPASFGIWRNDGSNSFDTGFEFILEEPQHLFLSIDFENNTWSASLDSAPLFVDATFTGGSNARTLGTIAAEWNITAPATPGNNWMLFDDWHIAARPRTEPPFLISGVERTAGDRVVLTYPADAGCTYHVFFSNDLSVWQELPDSPVTALEANPAATHTDQLQPGATRRYYKMGRELQD